MPNIRNCALIEYRFWINAHTVNRTKHMCIVTLASFQSQKMKMWESQIFTLA